jgi:hypothetical protein
MEARIVESFDALFPGRFLKAADLGNAKATAQIESVVIEQLEGDKGVEDKVLVSFVGKQKRLVLAKINGISLRAMFGSDVRQWIGKRVTLYATADVMPLRRGEACIRVYGSPDIERPLPVEWKPAKRNKLRWVLQPTGTATAAQPDTATDDDLEPFVTEEA